MVGFNPLIPHRTYVIPSLSSTCLQSSSQNSQANPGSGVVGDKVSFARAPSPETPSPVFPAWNWWGGGVLPWGASLTPGEAVAVSPVTSR